jgi:hypothetical protein
MSWPIVSRRRYEADLAAAKAETNRQRERAEKAEETARTELAARRTITRQHAELDADNRRLTGRNSALAKQLEAAQVGGGFDQAAARRTAQRIARLQKAVARARTEAAEERDARRALQKRWDGAFGMDDDPAITAGADWQDRREHHMRYDKPTAEGVAS